MHDVIILGAGAAGLAAASILREADLDILIIEARQRAGGRCWSVTHASAPLPLELGAEFVHGSARETVPARESRGIREQTASAELIPAARELAWQLPVL